MLYREDGHATSGDKSGGAARARKELGKTMVSEAAGTGQIVVAATSSTGILRRTAARSQVRMLPSHLPE